MINCSGRTSAFRAFALVVWHLRYDYLVMMIAVAVLLPTPEFDTAIATLSILGIGASVFIGFRNSNAYSRWWEARTLWGSVVINARSLNNGLSAVRNGSSSMDAILDRMRRRQVRHAWQLSAELRGIDPVPGVAELTPEDPESASATDLLNRQAKDVQALSSTGHIDPQARVMLMAANTGTVTAQSGLERIRNQPIPFLYRLFIRGLTWFFAIMAFARLDGGNHEWSDILVGFLLMATFITAERIGYLIEQPMRNSIFDLPLYRFCATITGDLLGASHPLAKPRDAANALVWM